MATRSFPIRYFVKLYGNKGYAAAFQTKEAADSYCRAVNIGAEQEGHKYRAFVTPDYHDNRTAP